MHSLIFNTILNSPDQSDLVKQKQVNSSIRLSKGVFLWDDLDQDQWSKITQSMVDQMNR